MAGFQKFPVPKYAYLDFWNYNKKWIGNTAFMAFGTILFWLSFNRYAGNRKRTNIGVGHYIDPSHEIAPQAVRL